MDQAKLVCTLYDQLIDSDVDSEGGTDQAVKSFNYVPSGQSYS
jgi:hypothetical protein